jgi:drug/metabolite transporter (DMT)-like permease
MLNAPKRIGRTDLMLVALVSIWAVNFSVVKSAISGPGAPFTPLGFNALRFGVAAAILLALLRRSNEALPASRRDWLALFGLGLVGNTLYQVLFIVGISLTSPANSSLIVALTPVVVALIGVWLRLERLTALAWIGIVMSFAGIAVVVLGNEAGASDASSLPGDALVLGATVVWAIYTTLAAPLLKRYSATMVTSVSLAAGTLPIWLVALPDLRSLEWGAVSLDGWAAVLYSGTFALAAGYVMWNRGVKLLGGARTAVYSNLIPIVAAAFAWLARGDAITIYHVIGAAIVLTGINLTRRGRQARLTTLRVRDERAESQ